LIPRINLRWELTSGWFSEKTPEESDDANTPQKNRPKSHIPERKITAISHRFDKNVTDIPAPECQD